MSGEELRALLAEGKCLCSYANTDWGGVLSLLDERDALRAQVERVRALADEWADSATPWEPGKTEAAAVRDALDGPQ